MPLSLVFGLYSIDFTFVNDLDSVFVVPFLVHSTVIGHVPSWLFFILVSVYNFNNDNKKYLVMLVDAIHQALYWNLLISLKKLKILTTFKKGIKFEKNFFFNKIYLKNLKKTSKKNTHTRLIRNLLLSAYSMEQICMTDSLDSFTNGLI